MELLQQEETLYKISSNEERGKSAILSFKLNRSLTDLNEKWIDRKFSDFAKSTDELKSYVEKLKQWDFKEPNLAGIISVQNGIGKTHLATCVYKKFIYSDLELRFDRVCSDEIALIEWINKDYDTGKIIFESEKRMIVQIQDSFNDKKYDSQKKILEKYSNADFLIIDDMFSLRQNEFARQQVFYIIDERAEWKNKPTFITSNLSLSEIADIDTRIADRIRNSMLFQVKEKMESFRKLI